MYKNIFSPESIAEALEALQTGIPFAIWETFYVTVLATFLALVIGLPLGRRNRRGSGMLHSHKPHNRRQLRQPCDQC